ncbi:MAG: alkaline phosphatase D family protein [Steroidobacteraceae bacterium]
MLNAESFISSRCPWLYRPLVIACALTITAIAPTARADGGAAPSGQSDPHVALDRTLTRIGFGSCAEGGKEQPIWQAVLAAQPELFLFLGDNIYGDTRDMAVLRAKYAELARQPGFAKLRDTTPLGVTWDDHDFGEDDAGGDYPQKEASRQVFLDFWGEPAGSPRRARDGVYASYVFGPPGQRVQVILLDLRYNRTPLMKPEPGVRNYRSWAQARHKKGLEVPGPYARNPDPRATMLGETQWQWLERQLETPAEVRLIGSSVQVLADFPGWEGWSLFARDQQRLIELIRRKRADGVVFLSGDMHYAELSKLDVNVPYSLWDLTSSGLTEVWPAATPNANRVSNVIREPNFGLIEIDWQGAQTTVTLSVMDQRGTRRIEQRLPLADLSARP